MLKTKALKPSHREKKRYIVYELEERKVTLSVQKQLVAKLEQLLGVFMSAQAGILPVKFENHRGILRVNHTAVDYIKSCFVLIQELGDKPATFRSISVSGILKKAQAHLQTTEEATSSVR